MIILTQGRSTFSKMQSFLLWSKYTHMAEARVSNATRLNIGDSNRIPDEDLAKNVTVVEAWHKGGVIVSENISKLHSKGTIVDFYDVPMVSTLTLHNVFDRMASQEGKPYDFRGILRFFHKLGKDRYLGEHLESPSWFCSELGYWAWSLEWGKLLQYDITDSYKIAPKHIHLSPVVKHVRRIILR